MDEKRHGFMVALDDHALLSHYNTYYVTFDVKYIEVPHTTIFRLDLPRTFTSFINSYDAKLTDLMIECPEEHNSTMVRNLC